MNSLLRFSRLPEEVFIPECPFCGKKAKGFEDKMCHVKSCGRKRGITAEKQLAALRLQQKQFCERKDLGLPAQETKQPKKSPVRFNKPARVVSFIFFFAHDSCGKRKSDCMSMYKMMMKNFFHVSKCWNFLAHCVLKFSLARYTPDSENMKMGIFSLGWRLQKNVSCVKLSPSLFCI